MAINSQFNINEARQYLKSRIKSGQYEIFFESSDILKVNMEKEQVDFASSGLISGIGIRVLINKKLGFSSTNNIANFKECVNNAIKISQLNNIDKNFNGFLGKQKYKKIEGYNKKLLNYTNDELKNYFKDYIQNIKSIDKEILVAAGQYEKSISTTRIINSEGLDSEKLEAGHSFSKDLLINGDTCYGSTDSSRVPLNPDKAFEDAERLKSMVEKSSTKTQDAKLLLHPEAAADIISAFIDYNFSGENAGLKKSKFFSSINKKETSKALTIIDDATAKGLLGTRQFDDEGFPSQKNVLIKRGIIKSFLYDSYNAARFKKKNTGSASRSYASLPAIDSSNLLVSPGIKPEKKLISSLDNAIYVKSLLGTHTIDKASGSLSLGVIEGHMIKNGVMQKAVKDTMIAGNLFEIFNNIEELSKEIKHGGSAIYTPHILIKNIKVIGN